MVRKKYIVEKKKYNEQDVLNAPFDIEVHKATFINYLKVVILEDGTIEYAVPSHQIKVTDIIAKQRNIKRGEVSDLCPKEYYFNYSTWLCMESKAIMVWDGFYKGKPNYEQIQSLLSLAVEKLYIGKLDIDWALDNE